MEAGDGVVGWSGVGGNGAETGGDRGGDGAAGGALFEAEEDGELEGLADGGVGVDDFVDGDACAVIERDIGDSVEIGSGRNGGEGAGGTIGVGVEDAREEELFGIADVAAGVGGEAEVAGSGGYGCAGAGESVGNEEAGAGGKA